MEGRIILIKKRLFLLLGIMFFFFSQFVLIGDEIEIEIKKTAANIRLGANNKSSIIGVFKKGKRFISFFRTGNWYRIKLDQKDAYIHASVVKVIGPAKYKSIEKNKLSNIEKIKSSQNRKEQNYNKNNSKRPFYFRGIFYQDWMGFKSDGSEFYNRLSNRLKLTLWNKPGRGFTVSIDLRNRLTLGESGKNQFIIYETKIMFSKLRSKFNFSLGQMNLYDSAGIGLLTGGLAGYKLNRFITIGGYVGFEPDIYGTDREATYQKIGFFTNYRGARAKQVSISFNRISYEDNLTRQFLYFSTLFPVKRLFILYGSLEYELAPEIKNEDRLSRIFTNMRVKLTKYADITANYSSGRGLDFERFIFEYSLNPTLKNSGIERYFYNAMYGMRLSIKPFSSMRFYAELRRSEYKDRGIINDSKRFGLSLSNVLKTGISAYVNYTINRGEASESDSYFLSISKSFSNFSWGFNLSNYYNGIRFTGDSYAEVIHIPDQMTVSTDFFLILNRSLSLAIEYSYSKHESLSDHQGFIRLIYRKRGKK